jgi:hypothetical protein
MNDDVMTATEVAERWHKSPVTVRQACSGYGNVPPRFRPEEIRKSGIMWLISKKAVIRVFGPEPVNDNKNP